MTPDNPLLEYLGIRLTDWGGERARFELTIDPRHLNREGNLQGGVAATMLDAACGYAGLWSGQDTPPRHAATVMLTITYLASVRQGDITAEGRVSGAGRSLFFAAAELRSDDGTLIATAQGTFKRSAAT
jgi:uncharacterized protein (TIGR00369 family)